MAEPLTPEEEQAIISKYWGLSGENAQASGSVRQPTSFTRDLGPPPPAPVAFQPNPGAAGYNPNPDATTATPAAPPPPEEPGPLARAFSSKEPLFQNPFAQPKGDVIELGGPPVGAPPPPTGPTADDDAEFARVRSDRDAKKAAADTKVASYWGGSGGSAPAKTSNPDPFGQLAAQKGRLGAYDDQMGAMGRARDADAVKATQIAEGQRDLARMQDEDAAIARLQGDIEKKHFDDGMQEIGRQLDDVRAAKLDPLRQMKESPALGVLAVIGGGLSGFYQGITGGQRNEFLDDLDRQLDRAHAEDERQLTDKKFVIGQGANLLGEQRQVQKDDSLARLQTRNLQYEAVKKQIDAQATEDEIPAARARADEMIAQTQGAQQLLAEQIANAKRTQAAAAGAAGVAQAREVQKTLLETYKEHLAKGFSPEQSMQAARSIVDTLYLGGGHVRLPKNDQSGLGPSGREEIAKENYRTTQEATGILNSIRSFDPAKVAAGGVYGAHAPNSLMSQGQKSERDERERYNALVRPAVGAAWRLQTHSPEPRNIELLDEQAKSFIIHPSDNDEDAARKKANLEQHMINAAKSGGIELPDARPSAKLAKELGAKPIR